MGEMDESKAGENVVKFLKFLLANDKLKWFGFESVSSYGQMFNYKTTDWEGHLKIILRHVFPYKKIWADAKQTKQISAPGYAERWKPVDASLHYNYFLLEVEYPDYWFSLRASNTEPVMRLIVEARNQKLMEQKRDELMTLLQA
jgi:phosphomannomutase